MQELVGEFVQQLHRVPVSDASALCAREGRSVVALFCLCCLLCYSNRVGKGINMAEAESDAM